MQPINHENSHGPEHRASIEQIERLAYCAWPAAEVHECDGWRFRFTYGVTHRANLGLAEWRRERSLAPAED